MKEAHGIAIKHMVCPRCITTVRSIAEEVGLELLSVGLGEVSVAREPTESQLRLFSEGLEANGFSIVVSKERRVINKVKSLILKRIHYADQSLSLKLSAYLADALGCDYGYLSKVFSAVEAMTIERYFTLQRIERAKELLSYDELNVTEIAEQLDFSSTAHFSAQFKQETGMSPSLFKKARLPGRRSLDSL